MTSRVSVCLLTYNHEDLIAAVLESILTQTYPDFELIVSDDCSTDATWELIQSIGRKDPRVRPVRTTRNLGMAGNANFAAGLAAGEYIALLHHDDIVSPTLIEKWLEVAGESNKVGFVFNDYDIEGGASHVSERRQFERHMDGQQFLRKHLLASWGCPVRGTALINRACFNAVGGMREQFSLLADVDLWMRLAALWDVGYVSEPLMRIGHQQPRLYPEEYTVFSWSRLRILFEIHAANLAAVEPNGPIRRRFAWWVFRSRVSGEVAKWVLYAVIRRNGSMMAGATAGANAYEWWPVRILREMVAGIGRAIFGVPHSTADKAAKRRYSKREVE